MTAIREIGGYKLLDPIGRGGMAEVWRAVRTMAGGRARKAFAVKLMRPEVSADARYRKMFLAEARIALKLGHQNIVSAFDAEEEAGRLYLAMEWVDGHDLLDLLTRLRQEGERLSYEATAYLISELLAGLQYAHNLTSKGRAFGLVHRDLNPNNVLISMSGEIKIADFGVARTAADETSHRHIKGKLRYMAPEQIRGQVQQATDLFGLGAILYEALTGKKFRGEARDEKALFTTIMEHDVPALPADVPRGLRVLHNRLLQADPGERPTASEAVGMFDELDIIPSKGRFLAAYRQRYGQRQPRSGMTESEIQAIEEQYGDDSSAITNEQKGAAPSGVREPDAPVVMRRGVQSPPADPSKLTPTVPRSQQAPFDQTQAEATEEVPTRLRGDSGPEPTATTLEPSPQRKPTAAVLAAAALAGLGAVATVVAVVASRGPVDVSAPTSSQPQLRVRATGLEAVEVRVDAVVIPATVGSEIGVEPGQHSISWRSGGGDWTPIGDFDLAGGKVYLVAVEPSGAVLSEVLQ